MSSYNYLTEVHKRTSDSRTSPKGGCVFSLQQNQPTRLPNRAESTPVLVTRRQVISVSVTDTQTPGNASASSLGINQAGSELLPSELNSHTIPHSADTRAQEIKALQSPASS